MPTRAEVLTLLRAGRSYEDIGDRLGVPPGQAYMIATGLPADGGDVLPPGEPAGREGLLPSGSGRLVNPPSPAPARGTEVGEWLKARARADAPMRQAAAQRTARPPRPADEETEDVLTVLGRDHNQVKYLQEQLEAVPGVRVGGDAAQQRHRVGLVGMIRERLVAHERAEEEHFWPAVRRVLPDGDDLAGRGRRQEAEGTALLNELAGLRGGEDRFDELVEKLGMSLRRHVAFEDAVLLRLQDAMSQEDRRDVGRRVHAAERYARGGPQGHGGGPQGHGGGPQGHGGGPQGHGGSPQEHGASRQEHGGSPQEPGDGPQEPGSRP